MNQHAPHDSPLGQKSEYPSCYAPELLFPIARSQGRSELDIGEKLPFQGVDIWTAYELSWLDNRGKPQVALAEIRVPCDSPNIIESKSLKLYFNSLNQTKFESIQSVKSAIESDLSKVAALPVSVLMETVTTAVLQPTDPSNYQCIDNIDTEITQYSPNAELLFADRENRQSERLVSHLLKSNCPVTGQPDWASLFIDYSGPRIDHAGLLRYLVSYRWHMGFHEQCVEQIFVDLLQRCQPEILTVNARYLRRGGLDINPVRSTETEYPVIPRLVRQ